MELGIISNVKQWEEKLLVWDFEPTEKSMIDYFSKIWLFDYVQQI